MRKIYTQNLLFLLLPTFFIYAQQAFTFEQAIQRVGQQPIVQQQFVKLALAENEQQLTERLRLPQVSGQHGQSVHTGRSIDPYTNTFVNRQIVGNSFEVAANYSLYNAGQTKLELQRSRQYAQLVGYEKNAIENQQRTELLLAFIDVLLAKEQLRLVEIQQNATNENLYYFRKLYEGNRVRYVEVRSIEAEQQRHTTQLITAQQALQQAQYRLGRLVGLPMGQWADATAQTETFRLLPELTTLIETAWRQLPELRAIEQQKSMYQTEAQVAYQKRLPVVALVGGFGTTYSSIAQKLENNMLTSIAYPRQLADNFTLSVGVSVKIPIYNTVNYQLAKQKSQLNGQLAEQQLNQKKIEIRGIIEEVYINYQATEKQYEALQKQVEINEEIYGLVTKAFREGRGELTAYLQQKRTWEESKQQLVRLYYERLLRYKQLVFFQTGKWQ